jgi:hypothetical protein
VNHLVNPGRQVSTVDVKPVQIEIAALERLPAGAAAETNQPLRRCGQLTCDQFTCQGTCRYTD